MINIVYLVMFFAVIVYMIYGIPFAYFKILFGNKIRGEGAHLHFVCERRANLKLFRADLIATILLSIHIIIRGKCHA